MHHKLTRFVAVALVAVLATALVPGVAFAGKASVARRSKVFVSQPRAARGSFRVGESFVATGFVTPAVPSDTTTTSVVVKVYKVGRRGRLSAIVNAGAVFTGPAKGGTGYSAAVSIPEAGTFLMQAVVNQSGRQVAASAIGPVRAIPAMTLSKLQIVNAPARALVPFQVTGVVAPGADAATGVTVRVTRLNVDGSVTEVTSAAASLTGPSGNGTAYSAVLTVANAGTYLLSAIGTKNGVPVGWSEVRPFEVRDTMWVSAPRVVSGQVSTSTAFEATGVVTPAIPAGDTHVGVFVRVIRFGRRGAITEISRVPATFTGPVGRATGFRATVTIATSGAYFLQAVGTRDGVPVYYSEARQVRAR